MSVIVDVINLITETSSHRFYVKYCSTTAHLYEAICDVLTRFTKDYGHTKDGYVYDFEDSIWDASSENHIAFLKSNIPLLKPVSGPL